MRFASRRVARPAVAERERRILYLHEPDRVKRSLRRATAHLYEPGHYLVLTYLKYLCCSPSRREKTAPEYSRFTLSPLEKKKNATFT